MNTDIKEPVTRVSGEVSRLKDVVSIKDKMSQKYYDDVIEKVFLPSWHLLGNANDLKEAGSYFALDIPTFKTSVLVVRDKDDVIRAFHNVCRHRGKKIVTTKCGWAEGKSSTHTCWLHGWTYNSDGSLRTVPDERAFMNLDKSQLGLIPVKAEVHAGQIFGYFGAEPGIDLKAWLGDLAEGFDGYYGDMEKISSFSSDVKANWNLAMDAFSEGYHTVFLHRNTQPELVGKSNPMRHQPIIDLYERHVRYSTVANPDYVGPPAERALYGHGRKLSPAVEMDHSGLPPGVNRTRYTPWFFDVVWHFPNVAILNGAHWVSVLTVWPIDRENTRLIFDHYARKTRHAGDRLAQAYERGLLVSVSREDLGAMEEVHAGLMSGAIEDMYLSRQEIVIQKRYALIDQILEGAQ